MFKLLGMLFLVMVLFFVVFVLLVVFKVRSTLRNLLNGKGQYQSWQEDVQFHFHQGGASARREPREPEGMVIDVEAQSRSDTPDGDRRKLQ